MSWRRRRQATIPPTYPDATPTRVRGRGLDAGEETHEGVRLVRRRGGGHGALPADEGVLAGLATLHHFRGELEARPKRSSITWASTEINEMFSRGCS